MIDKLAEISFKDNQKKKNLFTCGRKLKNNNNLLQKEDISQLFMKPLKSSFILKHNQESLPLKKCKLPQMENILLVLHKVVLIDLTASLGQ